MAAFLYFHPSVEHPVTPAAIGRIGLAYALGDCNLVHPTVEKGPGDQRGTLLADADRTGDRAAVYAPDDQTWRRVPGTDAWVGHWNDAKPTPADLLRKTRLPGYGVRLNDDNTWVIPVVRSYREASADIQAYPALPKRMEVDEGGSLVPGDLLPGHKPLWDAVADAWDMMMDNPADIEGQLDSNISQLDSLAVQLVAANHRVGVAEIVMLNLFTHPNTSNTMAILYVAMNFRAYLDIKKKQAARTSDTCDGSEASTPATSQA